MKYVKFDERLTLHTRASQHENASIVIGNDVDRNLNNNIGARRRPSPSRMSWRTPADPAELGDRPYPPGEQAGTAQGERVPPSDLPIRQNREKQKARRVNGALERQFHNYYEEATRLDGRTGDNLLQILESRLDNVVYRASFAKSRDMARQLVTHGHLMVERRKVDIPSYRVAENDIVEVRQKSRDMTPFVVAQGGG